MKKIIILWFIVLLSNGMMYADKFNYKFNSTHLSEALTKIADENPSVNLNFIYNDLDKYMTSAKVYTDNIYDALRQTIGLNPVSIIKNGDRYYVEALQKGKFCYTGRAIGRDKEPVVAATVMLLAPKDSTVITYGITNDAGYFSIPCDKESVIAKLSCLGYLPIYRKNNGFSFGTIVMNELPVQLNTLHVEADNASLYFDKSVYRPNQRQKNASQTATDLLARMAIPQLNVKLGSSNISTVSGEPVAMYIDYVPASVEELKMMKISDIRSVEYLQSPVDPRFQGNRNVINFRMIKYEYGGYVKMLATENFIANSGFLQGNARLVKRKMTYDIMGYGYYMNNNHFGIDQTENFCFPQENGDMISFQRESLTEKSKYYRQNYETSFRALYSGNTVTANSQVVLGLENMPHNDNSGVVIYSNELIGQSDYASKAHSKATYLNYIGYYFVNMQHDNSITASVNYLLSHTDQYSRYYESNLSPIYNVAKDNTHKGNIRLNYNQSLSNKHSIIAFINGLYELNQTNYLGSVNALDHSTTKFGQLGASYSFNNARLSASLGFGWCWMATKLNENKALSDFPYLDASLIFVPDKRNSFSAVFHYSVWPPSANYKSENLIQVSPFLWHTGNPLLKSHRSYDIGVFYTFIPTNKFNMSVFANSWLVRNRAAFVYEPTVEGIVRTIRQPIGKLRHYNYGISASTTQCDGKIYLSGQLTHLYVHNGRPYNTNRSSISYYIQMLYYLGNFNFALAYQSATATENFDSMSGVWTKNKDSFIVQAGWSNSSWNFLISAINLQRWNWRSSYETMSSDYYSINRWVSNASAHAYVQLSATYTFGFGKKINQDNNISKHAGASSGILK